MADIEAVEVLTQAKERILENGWGRGTLDRRTNDVDYCLEDALCDERGGFIRCEAIGAKYGDQKSKARVRSDEYVRRAIGDWHAPSWLGHYKEINENYEFEPTWRWNDFGAQSAGEVLDVIDRAVEIAKESPNPHAA